MTTLEALQKRFLLQSRDVDRNAPSAFMRSEPSDHKLVQAYLQVSPRLRVLVGSYNVLSRKYMYFLNGQDRPEWLKEWNAQDYQHLETFPLCQPGNGEKREELVLQKINWFLEQQQDARPCDAFVLGLQEVDARLLEKLRELARRHRAMTMEHLQDGDDPEQLVYGVVLYSEDLKVLPDQSATTWQWSSLPQSKSSESYLMHLPFQCDHPKAASASPWHFYNGHVDFAAPEQIVAQVTWDRTVLVGDMNMTMFPRADRHEEMVAPCPKSIVEVLRGVNVLTTETGPTHANCMKNCRDHPERLPDKFDHILFTPDTIKSVVSMFETTLECPSGTF